MEKTEIMEKLKEIIKNVLVENNNLVIDENTKATDIKGWDSLSHINIMRDIEKVFSVHFSIGEIVTLRTISDIIKIIEQKTK